MKHEALIASIEDGIPKNICRQQVTCKLDALKGERQRACQCLRESCLADAWDVLDQKMTAREQTGDRQFYRLILAYDNFTNLLREGVNVIGHAGTICGNNGFRKHDAGE